MNDTPTSARATTGLAVGAFSFAALAAAAGGVRAGEAVAWIGPLAALALAVLVPLRARASLRGALSHGAALVAGVTLALLAFGGGAASLGVAAYLVLGAVALAAGTRALGRQGQPVVTSLALGWITLPYWGQAPLGLLSDTAAMGLVLQSPLPILCGTFGGVDLLRGETLYQALPLGQSLPYAYASPWGALFAGLVPALLAGVTLAWRHRGSAAASLGPAPAVLAAVLVLFAAPERAEAQFYPGASQPSSSFEIGDLVTRVKLGYYLPRHRGSVKVDGSRALKINGVQRRTKGSAMDFFDDLNLTPIFFVPTFEVALNWNNGGLLSLEYLEGKWVGSEFLDRPLRFEGKVFQRNEFLFTRYRFRSIALRGELDIPIMDWLRAYIVTTHRYVKYEVTFRRAGGGRRDHDSLETIVPTIGIGADVLVWNLISAYGEIQYLDFTTDLFGTSSGSDERGYESRHHSYRVGVRLELVEHAHISVEYYGLELRTSLGNAETYKQDMHGVRIFVSVLF